MKGLASVLVLLLLSGCVSLPPFCEADFIGPRTSEMRLDCLEARMGNVETMAKWALGMGGGGVLTGAGALLATKRVADGVASMAASQ